MKKLLTLISMATVLVAGVFSLNAQDTGGKKEKEGGLIKTVVAVTGKVIDAETKKPVSVRINLLDQNDKVINASVSNSHDGYYYITKLIPGNTYYLSLVAPSYLAEKIELNIPDTDAYEEYSRDLLAYSKAANTKIKLNVPPFEIGKSKIKFGYNVLLSDYLSLLKSNPNVNFTVLCYPDDNKSPEANMKLTEARGESLKDYFSINGINPERITVKGNTTLDPDNPKPKEKAAKGKRYIGTTYLILE